MTKKEIRAIIVSDKSIEESVNAIYKDVTELLLLISWATVLLDEKKYPNSVSLLFKILQKYELENES